MTGGPGAVLVLGEALVDLVPVSGDGGVREARFGGAPANVAVGLAGLGTPVSFAGGLGDDGFAAMIEARLRAAGTDLSLCARSALPTALAVAEPDARGTGYHFHLQDTATFRLPDLSAEAAGFGAVYVGGLAAVVEPAASAVRATALAAAGRSLLVVDPNVRRDRTLGPDHGAAALRDLCGLAQVVKASDEDLERLWPGTPRRRPAGSWRPEAAWWSSPVEPAAARRTPRRRHRCPSRPRPSRSSTRSARATPSPRAC